MGSAIRGMLACALVACIEPVLAAPSTYALAAERAITWLKQQQNSVDGSWGASDDVKYLYTSETVSAMSAMNHRSQEYYAGVGWLKNRNPANSDYQARKVVGLLGSG